MNRQLLAAVLCVFSMAAQANAEKAVDLTPVTTTLGKTVFIDGSNEHKLPHAIELGNRNGLAIVLSPSVKSGRLSVKPNARTRIVDLRHGTGMSMVRGNHPRLGGMRPQYSNLNTGLRKNFVLSDVVAYDAEVEDWLGKPKAANQENKNRAQTSSEFANTHNHYQNFLSEVWSFSPTINAVALWGDSGAFFPGARSWGGFLSARSWPVHWGEYVPPGTPEYQDKDFDAALVGLEVDVLNYGMPHGTTSSQVGIPLSKIGVQVVGFGKTNTAAVELRSEDSDDNARQVNERRGTWHYGIIEHHAMNEASTLLMTTTPTSKSGLDLSRTRFSEGALKVNSDGQGTGIRFMNAGELYAEGGRQVMRIGPGGLQVVSPTGMKIASVDGDGNIEWHGVKIASPKFYKLFFFILVIFLAMSVILWKFAKNLRSAQLVLESMRQETGRISTAAS